ncbi:hypothetical protein B0H63DRAFT_513573 [Podospora didyma]|uniref:Heterokaryon incompatibility domain-containing protein n=1 Tax=Podospora didyma TaxID=330526 RepID=A0AAE0K8D1_9PEZI|nr:hypothetical protein B0H63DRAFT_513573 [Podospora didyma]
MEANRLQTSYNPLDTPTSFHILELLPGRLGDPIKCELHEVHWADSPKYDAISLNQREISERGLKVKEMHKIYEQAQKVLIWIGPDNETHQVDLAFDAVMELTAYFAFILGIWFHDLKSEREIFVNIVFKNARIFPLPSELSIITKDQWQALLWLYKHPYFTRLWVVQEISANKSRRVCFGGRSNFILWEAVELLHMLYLAFNFGSADPRDVVFGLRSMMDCKEGGELLDPDYSKDTTTVYRDSVEAAFVNYKTSNALLYAGSDFGQPSRAQGRAQGPLGNILTIMAYAFSFGLDVTCSRPAEKQKLFHNFVRRLRNVLDQNVYNRFISPETTAECEDGDADVFGRPVWNCDQPLSGFFITKGKRLGCCIAPVEPGHVVFIPQGSTYPLVLQKLESGVMEGEEKDTAPQTVIEMV